MARLRMVEDCADAQTSIQTVSLNPQFIWPYHLKMSLACKITSTNGHIETWTARALPYISELLQKRLHPNFWVIQDVASVTGSQEDFRPGRHISCILRQDLESRARANGETLAVAAALQEKVPGKDLTYPEMFMGLVSVDQKIAWFEEYVRQLFQDVMGMELTR